MTCPVPLACGILFILSQILQRRPHLVHSKENMPGSSLQGFEEEDDEEKYEDVRTEEVSSCLVHSNVNNKYISAFGRCFW